MKPDKRFRDSKSKIAQQAFWLGQLLINGMPASCSALYFLIAIRQKSIPHIGLTVYTVIKVDYIARQSTRR